MRKQFKLLTIIMDGFEELEATAPIDLCRRSNIIVDIATTKSTSVTSAHQITWTNVLSLEKLSLENYDGLFIPGGPHYMEIEKNEIIKNAICYFWVQKKLLVGICAAPTIFGQLGILKEKNYTCFPPMNSEFGGTFLDQYIVRDHHLITARSASASILLGLEIIKYFMGVDQAEYISKAIYL